MKRMMLFAAIAAVGLGVGVITAEAGEWGSSSYAEAGPGGRAYASGSSNRWGAKSSVSTYGPATGEATAQSIGSNYRFFSQSNGESGPGGWSRTSGNVGNWGENTSSSAGNGGRAGSNTYGFDNRKYYTQRTQTVYVTKRCGWFRCR